MIYKNKYFVLDTSLRKVFDENNKELKITGNSFRVLVFLCEHGQATITDISDALDRAKDYDEDHIRQYRYKINTLIGKNIVKYENKIYFIDGGTEKTENKDSLILDKNNRNTDLLQPDSVKFKIDSNATMSQKKYCQKCGKENQKNHRFCVFCGALLEKEKVELSISGGNNKFFKLTIGAVILLISVSFSYYFLLFLPTKEKAQKDDLITKDNQLTKCLSLVESNYFSKCKAGNRVCNIADTACSERSNDPIKQETINSLCAKLTFSCENGCKPSENVLNNLRDNCFKQYR
ncbi:hypothetical protein COX73_01200 [bacterium (Candidatus Gribaldobacteria) CG_4_10_14_0_2_um_filter_36_18]|uniref:Zinc-ribbon domain-containing protein n=1 Tax=bacterium (Candidatus Gribaldobacteria) CG_4_10_14_0_2_um_filter_36_18 TaxID=2014264 RepID=A0A2M7VKH7_9BACT|nr:MAG: hypothetical protein COX73_01200 [bacterium (Candidatus Gribaldobacteria) CG_4_10_14_0_2_um_filter_36_18]